MRGPACRIRGGSTGSLVPYSRIESEIAYGIRMHSIDHREKAREERRRSIKTAVMITAPIADPCQNGDTFRRFKPFRIMTIIRTPINDPIIDPRPPYKLAPPITTAAMASSSSPVPASGSIDMTCAEAKVIATADNPPEMTYGRMLKPSTFRPAVRAASRLEPIAYTVRPPFVKFR